MYMSRVYTCIYIYKLAQVAFDTFDARHVILKCAYCSVDVMTFAARYVVCAYFSFLSESLPVLITISLHKVALQLSHI